MKFLCDRCKTRYSIGDDRVRGKILKIRCKNCANVITVREGMTVDEELGRGRPTTAAPIATGPQVAAGNAGGALASAFAQQMTKPPPALEEEWYVSIDGQQAGPFGLAEAQRWVSSKPFDAELHCWSEGFDDWLLVDKVSHFRGLRKKPSPAALPPVAAAPPPRPRPPEDEPKPLFAATMASLERAATAQGGAAINVPSKSASAQVPAIPAIPSVMPGKPATNGIAAKANGTGPAARIPTVGTPAGGAKPNGSPTPAQAALAAAFDVSGPAEAPALEHEPFRDLRANAPASKPVPEPADDDDDNLEIGEVSRVVNLADLARSHRQKAVSMQSPAATPRPSLGRMTAQTPKLDPSHVGVDATASIDALPAPPTGLAAAPVVAQAHRRGLIMLIGVAAVLLAGVTVALVLILNGGNDNDDTSLGPTAREIDTSRPDEIVRLHMQAPAEGSASAPHQIHHTQIQTHPTTGPNAPETPDTPGSHLQPEEIEDMAQKNSNGTQRCYMRAQRGEMGLELGDLKKISVTLQIDKTGTVNDVQLSDHAGDSLGACLSSQIKRWKFRESSGGQFRIVLAFAAG
ncbi:MAG TPA: GYF domain-containing protein [Kofleriaceae bacterium]